MTHRTRHVRHVTLAALCALVGCSSPEDDPKRADSSTAPVVQTTVPQAGAMLVSLDSTIALTFSMSMDTTPPAPGALRFTPALVGTYAWGNDGKTLTFTPSSPLTSGTRYTVTTTDAIRSAAGIPIKAPFTLTFTSTGEVDTGARGDSYEWKGQKATVKVVGRDSETRLYTMNTTAQLRDNQPPTRQITFKEEAGQLIVRSGHDMFDALFALAVEETRQNSVESISDGGFNNGQGVPCSCFETGEKWRYVWTRDTAYAVDLGLALIDPARSRRSLEFKLSERKAGGDLQIVQDTGTGGSYPVSTDRVVWSIGAAQAYQMLTGDERAAFALRSYEALKNTVEQDRRMVFDEKDGLYFGEQSFLDWREQSYASWTRDDTVHIAMSKSLSTNVGHFAALASAAFLAQQLGHTQEAATYQAWASELRQAIVREFWLEDVGMLSALKATGLDEATLHKYDWLGASLAVLLGVIDGERAERMIASYPHTVAGPPVLWPQQPLIPVYHNRGIWPFVTAYGVLAAREVRNDAVFEHGLESLIRGAALNLSNMENFEFLTQAAWFDDGEYSGPVVNSRRQLWSVAGYLGAIVRGVFGMSVQDEGVTFKPFITRKMRRTWFQHTDRLQLRNLSFRGKKLHVTVELPTLNPDDIQNGAYTIDKATLNGDPIDGPLLPTEFADGDEVVIALTSESTASKDITIVEDDGDFTKLWAPREPNLTAARVNDNGLVELAFDAGGEEGVTFNIYRDGEVVKTGVTATSWVDTGSAGWDTKTYCYAVESVFASGNRSHHSKPACVWGEAGERATQLNAFAMMSTGGKWATDHGRAHFGDWGAPSDRITVSKIRPKTTGAHRLQLVYGNGAGPISTGITAAVKKVTVSTSAGEVVGQGTLVMPQLGDWSRWADSTFLSVELKSNTNYTVTIEDDPVNMSFFAHFTPYTASNGGGEGTYNMVNIHALKLLAMDGEVPYTEARISFDGLDDLGKLPRGAVQQPGAQLDTWTRFGMTWDDDFLYIAMVTTAFEEDFAPVMIYLEPFKAITFPPRPTGAVGMPYDKTTSRLSFTPSYVIAARAVSEDSTTGEPWNGVWQHGGDAARESWEKLRRLEAGVDWWLSQDRHTISIRVPRQLVTNGINTIRLAAHVYYGEEGNEWKETVPSGHEPWRSGGDYYQINLSNGEWKVMSGGLSPL